MRQLARGVLLGLVVEVLAVERRPQPLQAVALVGEVAAGGVVVHDP